MRKEQASNMGHHESSIDIWKEPDKEGGGQHGLL